MLAYLTMWAATLCVRHSLAYGTKIISPTLTLYMYCRRCLDTRVSNPPCTIYALPRKSLASLQELWKRYLQLPLLMIRLLPTILLLFPLLPMLPLPPMLPLLPMMRLLPTMSLVLQLMAAKTKIQI